MTKPPDLSAYAVDLRPRRRPGFSVRIELCTWDLAVLRVEPDGRGAPVFLARPHDDLAALYADLDAGVRDEDLRRALRRPPHRHLRRPPRRPLRRLGERGERGELGEQRLRIGVEHEFVVTGPAGQLDFRTIVGGLSLGVRADPTDPNAQRCPWGGVVTTDGREAEIATPPVPVAPGATYTVAALAAYGRDDLASALGPDVTLTGYSTHLNVSAPDRGADRLARRFAQVFAPGLMLLLDRPDSPGLLVRPRPGRLELGGEYADGPALRVALAYAVGGVLACRTMSRRTARALTLDVHLERAVERYGWFVGRTAFGEDLYAGGRGTVLRLAGGRGADGTRSAGEQLALTWRLGRASLAGLLDPTELDAVDEVVAASSPLPRL